MSSVRIALGIPHLGEMLPAYFMDSVFALDVPHGDTLLFRVPDKPVDVARNMVVEQFLASDATHLFFMDSDMAFPRDAVFRLVERDKPIIGGTYFARAGLPIPHAYRFHHQDNPDGSCPEGREHRESRHNGRWYRPTGNEFAAYLRAHPEYRDGPYATVFPRTDDALLEVDALGTGCMLIQRWVIEQLPDPWFVCDPMTAGGEDFYFCDRAKEAGIGVWTDFSVQCGHELRPMMIARQDFERRFRTYEDDPWDFEKDGVLVQAYAGGPIELREEPTDTSAA